MIGHTPNLIELADICYGLVISGSNPEDFCPEPACTKMVTSLQILYYEQSRAAWPLLAPIKELVLSDLTEREAEHCLVSVI